jgi:release factor glutamine methyltransferase
MASPRARTTRSIGRACSSRACSSRACSDRAVPEPSRCDRSEAARRLAAAGCVAAEAEAEELAASASGDDEMLAALVERRSSGEPLAWITGTTLFCGHSVAVTAGVYVPRWQSEQLARRAAALLPPGGRAIDLGTGSGAIACALLDRRPDASVLGTERDPVAARCARRNGVNVVDGDLFEGVPSSWRGTVDVIVAVLPYVPTDRRDRVPPPRCAGLRAHCCPRRG